MTLKDSMREAMIHSDSHIGRAGQEEVLNINILLHTSTVKSKYTFLVERLNYILMFQFSG